MAKSNPDGNRPQSKARGLDPDSTSDMEFSGHYQFLEMAQFYQEIGIAPAICMDVPDT
jgi:hypothetical protein